jgi:hypothetical protein
VAAAADFDAHDHCSCTSEPVYEGSLPPADQLIQDPDDPELFYERPEDVGRQGVAHATFELPDVRRSVRQDRRDLARAEQLGDQWEGDSPDELRLRIRDGEAEIALLEQLKRRVPQ